MYGIPLTLITPPRENGVVFGASGHATAPLPMPVGVGRVSQPTLLVAVHVKPDGTVMPTLPPVVVAGTAPGGVAKEICGVV